MNNKFLNFLKINLKNNSKLHEEILKDLKQVSSKFINSQENINYLFEQTKQQRVLMNKYNVAIKKDESKLREKIANRCGLSITK